jgi:putative membrane protein
VSSTQPESAARDRLAAERSRLANERTSLAYARTALAVVVVAVTLLHVPALTGEPLFSAWAYVVLGWVLLAVGLGIAIVGVLRYRQVARRIAEVYPGPEEPDD